MTGAADHTGVVLAAGRGSRLGAATAARPKCMVELGGSPLLAWQLRALHEAGIERVAVVTGYRCDIVEERGVATVHNPDWERTNMVGSLLCALDALPPPFVVSYSDIVYPPEHVRLLLECPAELAITYDTAWLSLWERRFDDPLRDAESFVVDADDRIVEIGAAAANVGDIQGQFMGLLRVSGTATRWVRDLVEAEPQRRAQMDTTGLLSALITDGRELRGVAVSGGWCEIDDEADLRVAESLLAEGVLPAPPAHRG